METNMIYTDENGIKHPARQNDTNPGKNGYVGIIYMLNGAEHFEFVELESVEWTR